MKIELGQKLELGQIKVERTGFAPGDRIGEWVARCYLEASLSGMRFAYGASEEAALKALEFKLKQEEEKK